MNEWAHVFEETLENQMLERKQRDLSFSQDATWRTVRSFTRKQEIKMCLQIYYVLIGLGL